MNELINNARTNRNQHRSSTLPGLQLQETLWWLGVVGLLVYLWGLLQFITGDWQSCWLAGPHELVQLLHQAPPNLGLWGKLFSRCLALLLSSESLKKLCCFLQHLSFWQIDILYKSDTDGLSCTQYDDWHKRNRAEGLSFLQFALEFTLGVTWINIEVEQEHQNLQLTRKVAWTRSPDQKWATKVFNPQKTKSFPPPWPKTACNLAKVTQQKGRKKKQKKMSRLFRIIMPSPPLTSSFRSSSSANCPLLHRKASPGTGTHCCRMLCHLWWKKREKGPIIS